MKKTLAYGSVYALMTVLNVIGLIIVFLTSDVASGDDDTFYIHFLFSCAALIIAIFMAKKFSIKLWPLSLYNPIFTFIFGILYETVIYDHQSGASFYFVVWIFESIFYFSLFAFIIGIYYFCNTAKKGGFKSTM